MFVDVLECQLLGLPMFWFVDISVNVSVCWYFVKCLILEILRYWVCWRSSLSMFQFVEVLTSNHVTDQAQQNFTQWREGNTFPHWPRPSNSKCQCLLSTREILPNLNWDIYRRKAKLMKYLNCQYRCPGATCKGHQMSHFFRSYIYIWNLYPKQHLFHSLCFSYPTKSCLLIVHWHKTGVSCMC